ncbi:hypothetical protein KSP40_PGU005099 [Platanthera guangdongensis]|uniref:Ribosomal protein S12 n=1 Tax=Platanthera guangdongensis TaxID=2320717 RepID=A0ABR2LC68_9ASPA
MSNRHDIFAHIPGQGHTSQEHPIFLVRGGRVKDSPGVKSHCIRGVKDLLGIADRTRGRSKYGAERPNRNEWKMPPERLCGKLSSIAFGSSCFAYLLREYSGRTLGKIPPSGRDIIGGSLVNLLAKLSGCYSAAVAAVAQR